MSSSQQNQQQTSSRFMTVLPWLLLGVVLGMFIWYLFDNINNDKSQPSINPPANTAQISQNEPSSQQAQQAWQPPRAENNETTATAKKQTEVVSYHDAVAKASQSVVNIYTTQKVADNPYMNDPILRRFFDFEDSLPRQSHKNTNLGSGVIVSDDGYIVTNAHVVEKADEIIVALNDGRKGRATVIGIDAESDLAVIKVQMTDLTPLVFRAEPIEVGDVALAIGNPFGVGQTVTQGIISATGRTGLGVNTFEDFIQTDAAINPGNSGGALVDAYGELVGINTMIFSRSGGSMGIGFAIPTAIVEQVMNALIEHGRVSRGWLGIEVQSQIKDPTKLDNPTGVMVMNIIPSSPADKSGLQVGDVIINIDGKEMKDANTLVQYVARKLPNTLLKTQVQRDGATLDVAITLAERPSKKDLISGRLLTPDQSGTGSNEQPPRANRQPQNNEGSSMTPAERERLRRELLELFEREMN